MLEETHYYPFGLTMAGISSKALEFGNPENKYKYNGIEKESDLGLEVYDAQLRELDGQTGRWWQIDPKTENMEMWSPYASNYDNPIRYKDPLGDEGQACCGGLWDEIKQAAKETWSSVKDAGKAVYNAGKDFYNNGVLPGVDWINHNLNSVYGAFNGAQAQFTGKDFLSGAPMSRGDGAIEMGLSIIPGTKLEAAAVKTLEKAVVKEGVEQTEKQVAKQGGLWTSTKKLNSVENAFEHFKKHKSEFPEFKNAKEYAEGAKDFLQNSPEGTLMKTRPNGDVLKYNPTTNTFGVMDAKGTPKTMFKPEDGMKYWQQQK
ncbi:MAG: RHS repeat-associated core domain-containing protein [Chitinophagaceae bacterium]